MITVSARTVRLESLEGGADRFGVLLEDPATGRSILALGAATLAELKDQLESVGGPVAYARRFGVMPLDPQGVAADSLWVPPEEIS